MHQHCSGEQYHYAKSVILESGHLHTWMFLTSLTTFVFYRYQREFAIMFHEHSCLVLLHDKHHLKVGEPGLPVAAAERGKKVIVGLHNQFQVADHDFTRFSMVPTVAMVCDVPESMEESFYRCVWGEEGGRHVDVHVCVCVSACLFTRSSTLCSPGESVYWNEGCCK